MVGSSALWQIAMRWKRRMAKSKAEEGKGPPPSNQSSETQMNNLQKSILTVLPVALIFATICGAAYVLTVQNRPKHEPAIIDICPDVFPEPVTPTPEPPLIDPEPTPEPVKPAPTKCRCGNESCSPACSCGCRVTVKEPLPVQGWVQVTEQVQVCNGGQCQIVTQTRWVRK